ncbi:putative peptidase (DUF1758) [Popillia japonica]|uniref:Peptidase (DUF1758) n=1 Tax=Popillia japonica TaxID=7064 RepID=A0AAW1IEH8_POPJA
MENNTEMLSSLNLKRGQLKAQITRFKTFLATFSVDNDIVEVESRLHAVEGHALEQFNDIQNQIENLQNSEIQDEQRDAFENAYFKAISDAKRLIADKNKVSIHSSSDRDSNMIPIVSEVDARGRVKLPQLNLPEFHGQALLDSGSTSNFITKALAQKLKLDTTNTNVPIVGVNNTNTAVSSITDATITSCDGGYNYKGNFLIINTITRHMPQLTFDITKVNIPEGIQLADAKFNESRPVEVMNLGL